MAARPVKAILAATLALLAGCTMSPLFLIERPLLEDALPKDIAMSDFVETDWMGYKVTVAEKLARLGAFTDGDVICDGTGQEIRFYKHQDQSLKASPELLQREQKEVRELKKRFTVIEVRREPPPQNNPVPPQKQ